MRYLSVCSGIEAATVAWHPLGWQPVAFAEIDPFASALLAHYYPDVPNLGDMTAITDEQIAALGPIDLVVGGTPCQDLSIAGRRAGLAGERSSLFYDFVRIFDAARRLCGARWCLWENVPGSFSSHAGRDFAVVVATLAGLDELVAPKGGWGNEGLALGPRGLVEWCVLDAQWFDLAQRRERVFALLDSGDWSSRPPVLLEPESLRGNSPPSREAGARVAASLTRGADSSGKGGYAGRRQEDDVNLVAHTLRAEGYDASEDGTGRGIPLISNALTAREGKGPDSDATTTLIASTLRANSGRNQIEGPYVPELADPITANEQRTYTHEGKNNFRTRNVVACFDETQITHPENRSLARPDSAALASSARPPTVAFDMRGRDGGGGSSRSFVLGGSNADAAQTRSIEALRILRKTVAEETLCQWSLGIIASFWPQEVLRPEVHGGGIRCTAKPKRGLVNVALSRSKDCSGWTVRDLWEAGGDGCPPQGWQPSEQLARELGAYLSELPYTPSPAERFMRDMWRASEGARLLRQALSTVQEARRSSCGEIESAQPAQVRRLTAEECEALQGFPRSYTLIPYRGKPASDSARYKALGNSMAVPVMRWIGERIQMVNRRMPAFLRSQAG